MESGYKVPETSVSNENENSNQNIQFTTQETPAAGASNSGGPRTQQGKERSKHNSLKRGIFSRVALLKGEPRAEFDSLLRGLREALEPEGALEELLVDKLVTLAWRHRRLIIADGERPLEGGGPLAANAGIVDAPPRDLLLRYESSLERAFDRTLNQLERLQLVRKGQPVLPALNVNLST